MTSRWTQCLCADDWTGLYCDEKKEPPSIEDQSDQTRNAANVLTTSSCSRYLMSFQIHNSISEEVWVIMITSAQWFTWIYLKISTERYPFDHQLSHINVTVKSITTWKALNWCCLGKIIYFIDIILIRLNGFKLSIWISHYVKVSMLGCSKE